MACWIPTGLITMNAITLSALAGFPQQLEDHYAAIPAGFEHWAPHSWDGVPSERLTAIEQVCHVRDIEIEGYHVRFQRTLHKAHPTLPGIDSEALAVTRSYATSNASDALATFRAARATTLQLIARLQPEQWRRTALFDDYGPTTVRGLAHYLCSHDQQHLAGLQWLLGKIEAVRMQPRS